MAAYFQNQNSPSIARTAFRKMLKMKTFVNGPSVQTITRWAMEFEATGSVASRSTRSQPVTARTPEVIQRVQCIVKRKPVMSIRRIASAAGFKKSTTQVILRRNLQLRAFKIQIVKSLKSTDPANRLEFAQVMGERFQSFIHILFSDEPTFIWMELSTGRIIDSGLKRTPAGTCRRPYNPKKLPFGLDWPHGVLAVSFSSRTSVANR